MAAADWQGAGTSASPYIIPPNDLPWCENILSRNRVSSATGNVEAARNHFRFTPSVSGTYSYQLIFQTDGNGIQWSARGINVGGTDQIAGGVGTGTSARQTVLQSRNLNLVAGTAYNFYLQANNTGGIGDAYLTLMAPPGTDGQRLIMTTRAADVVTINDEEVDLRDNAGFHRIAGGGVNLPAAWFASGATNRDMARFLLLDELTSDNQVTVWVRLGQGGNVDGPQFLESFRSVSRLEIMEVTIGATATPTFARVNLGVIGGTSDQTEPYSWRISNANDALSWLANDYASTSQFQIALTKTVPIVTVPLQGSTPIVLDHETDLSVILPVTTEALQGNAALELDSETDLSVILPVTTEALQGNAALELDSELDLSVVLPVTTEALQGNAALELDDELNLSVVLPVTTEALQGNAALELDDELNLSVNVESVTVSLQGNAALILASEAALTQTQSVSLTGEMPVIWGDSTDLTVIDTTAHQLVGWTLEIRSLGSPARTVRWWSGRGQITIDSYEYNGATLDGGAFLSISPVETGSGNPNRRATVRMLAVGEVARRLLQQDYGPIPIKIGWIFSNDNGASWESIGRSFEGRLSAPLLKNGIYTVEVETYLGDIDKGIPRKWSYQARVALNNDKFFEAVASYSAGGLQTRWPT